MLKKTITYENFEGERVSEDHFFHISKAELVEMEVSKEGGMQAYLQKVIDSEDGKEIIATFKMLVLESYGKKSDDGKRFIKNQQLREEFESSEAYSTLFMELVTNAEAAAEFANGIIPKGLEAEAAQVAARASDQPETPAPLEAPRGVRGGRRVISIVEAREMEQSELSRLLASGEAILGNSSEG